MPQSSPPSRSRPAPRSAPHHRPAAGTSDARLPNSRENSIGSQLAHLGLHEFSGLGLGGETWKDAGGRMRHPMVAGAPICSSRRRAATTPARRDRSPPRTREDTGMARRRILLALAGAAALPRAVRAAEWQPDHSITMIVAYAAGGGTDTAARTLARFMERDLGQPVVVTNRPGAGGEIGWSELV